jgi:RimJ/RimL family protein N-acetyltransferase
MNLRPATIEDADLLLRWRNDLGTRLHSFKQDIIAKEEHLAWLQRRIDNPEHEVWIIQGHAIPCATVRFDSRGDDAFEVGIIVAPEIRGEGLGAEILGLACTAHRRHWLFADVKAGNVASQRIFERTGFTPVGGDETFTMYRRKPL